MQSSRSKTAMNQYSQVTVQGGVADASPHRLIQMLIDGALQRIASARCAMENGNVSGKGKAISSTIVILESLRQNLDHKAGGSLAGNLDELYAYMSRKLIEANLKNDDTIMSEVNDLLKEIKSAWDAIPQIIQNQSNQINGAKQAG